MLDAQAQSEARSEIVQEYHAKLRRFADHLELQGDWSSPAAQATLRRMVALCWPHIDRYSRSKFLAYLDEDWLFNPPADLDPVQLGDLEMVTILQNWPDVISGLEGKELQFAQDVDKRRRWRNWKPSEKQIEWIKVIWATHVETIGIDPEVTE